MMFPTPTALRSIAAPLLAAALWLTPPGTARADAEAEAAIRAFTGAIMTKDSQKLAAVLAPEFQLMRSNGDGFNRAEYAGGGFASITGTQKIDNLVATRAGDLLVTRYHLTVEETIGGKQVQRTAPRLTVFRRAGSRWLVVGHANFARIN